MPRVNPTSTSLESKYHVTIYNSAGQVVRMKDMNVTEFVNFEQEHLTSNLDYEYQRQSAA